MVEIKHRLIKPIIRDEEIFAVTKVLRSGWLTEGDITRDFERRFANFVGSKYAIATTNCTSALEACLRAVGVKEKSRVIVPDFTHPATADVVRLLGGNVILADVDLKTRNIDIPAVVDYCRNNSNFFFKYIIPVSFGGYPLDPDQIKYLREEGMYVIEDAACSHGSSFKGIMTGNMADLTCFSFHPRKVITTGEGGMITTNNEDLYRKIVSFKNFGIDLDNYNFSSIGSNLRMSNILGAVGLEQLKKINWIIAERDRLAKTYHDLLDNINGLWAPGSSTSEIHFNHQTYAVLLDGRFNRDKIIENMKLKGIETQIGTYALHLHSAFENCERIGNLITSEVLYKCLLTLPIYHGMTYEDQNFVVESLKEELRKL